MLHPTNLPACAPVLECILDFQESLLVYACSHTEVTRDHLETEFGSEIAAWLHDNRQMVLDPLKHFMSEASQPDKETVLARFRHDRQFSYFYDDPSYQFQLVTTPESPAHLTQIKQWLNGYYSQLRQSGYHPAFCGHQAEPFCERDWWNGYYQENPKRFTCAICDADINAGGRTIDHFLPKSQYPALSVHPANLVPLCKPCNSEVKRDKDPLEGRSLRQVFLPYYRDIRSEIRLEFSKSLDGGYQVRLFPIRDEPDIQERINCLTQIFDLPRRWEKAISAISETAFSQVRFYLQALQDTGNPVNVDTLRDSIAKTCSSMEKEWGKIPNRYLATEWLRWAAQNQFNALAQELLEA